MNGKKRAREITGRIHADRKLIQFGQSCVVISWETTDPAGVQVCVVPEGDDEKLMTQTGTSGQIEIPGSRIPESMNFASMRPVAPMLLSIA